VEIAENVLRPVQHELGRRWMEGDLCVADENAASAATESSGARLGAALDVADGPAVVVASPEDDAHALGGRVVATALSLGGFSVRYLGASVPTTDLAYYLELQAPFALALSVSIPSAFPSAARAIRVAHDVGIPVLLGGAALMRAERAGRLGADAFALGPRDAMATLERWQDEPVVAFGTTPEPSSEAAFLRLRMHALVAASLAGHDSVPVEGDLRLGDEIERLLLVIEAGLLLDEPELVAQQVSWLRELGPAHGVSPDVVDAAIDQLAVALEEHAPRSEALLRASAR
jgi:methanogenic corrinoid protein MtbC1